MNEYINKLTDKINQIPNRITGSAVALDCCIMANPKNRKMENSARVKSQLLIFYLERLHT